MFLKNQPKEAFAKRCPVKMVFLEISQNSKEYTSASLFFNKVAGFSQQVFIKKETLTQRFPVNLAKFLRTPFLQSSSGGNF